ncbi:MAG: DUF4173 domain-containing protein [Bacteroidota bacterium]
MESPYSIRLACTIGLAVLFNLIFWQEKVGINLPVFSFLIMAALLLLEKNAIRTPAVWLSGLGSLLTGGLVVLHHSDTAVVVHILSMLLFVGFAHQPALRTVFHGFANGISNLILASLNFMKQFEWVKKHAPGMQKLQAVLRVSLWPVLALVVFFFIFFFANPRFALFSSILTHELGLWLGQFSLLRSGFFILGLFLCFGLLYAQNVQGLLQHDLAQGNQLSRLRRQKRVRFPLLGLKKEYQTAFLLVALVNVLLLINNLIDIRWIWIDFQKPDEMSLRQFVHEGTWLLIFSILLSMGIMLYYFRGNLNFFKQNRTLKWLSYTWIVQNVILVISVGLRNVHYITYHGLAYKRIGVFFFLLLTLFGLATLFLKIRDRMSMFYLFRTNGWAVYAIAICLALVNWDSFIAKHNLTRSYSSSLDTVFLLSLSDKTLPLLIENVDQAEARLSAKGQQEKFFLYRHALEEKADAFLGEQSSYTWLSWNWAEAKAVRYLQEK